MPHEYLRLKKKLKNFTYKFSIPITHDSDTIENIVVEGKYMYSFFGEIYT